MNIGKIISIVLISVFIWGVSLYNGWLNEVVLFGRGMFIGWINGNSSQISWNNNTTTIKNGEFAYRLLDNIVIPENINNIRKDAFKGNKLTCITIGSNVSIEKDAFGYDFENVYNNNNKEAGTFTRVNHKSTEWIIWYDNFSYRNYNSNITITGYNGNITIIGYNGIVIIPNEIYGNPVTEITTQAFKEKWLTSVTIPDTVTSIGNEAFYGNKIADININNNVTYIGPYSFMKNQLTKIVLPINIKTIDISAFAENKIETVIIPNSVIHIENGAFYSNQLTSINIGNNVNYIGRDSFKTNKLTRVVIPNSVKSIGVNAFADNQITTVSIGENVSLGSDSKNGILGEGTGFNSAYRDNKSRAGVYTRPNTKSSKWTRIPR